ncbi:patatin-like protein [Mycolicibacterium moriokaense]|nr:patatin-like protein [Mycolicibacterium moriokaense]
MNSHEAELRLALVCYGGVSLAVYMHGVTKELHKLVVAAREFDQRRADNPFTDGTEAVYYDALTDIASDGPRLVVSIDIVGGTSAGGINGIALSKAIARDASLEPLKQVWIDDGDIRKLLRGTKLFGLAMQVATTVGRQLTHLFGPSSPLRGEYMSTLLFTALTDMEKTGADDGKSLMPRDAKLELYVPTTDLNGFDVLVASGVGGASNRDRDYRQVLVFSGTDDKLEQFGADYTADLAFAGRASASFPGAFAPVSQASFRTELGGQGANVRLHPETVFLCQYPAGDAADVYFVDGGVLDNAPFDLVIDAIARRKAERRVHRQLVYIEPDPGQQLYSKSRKQKDSSRRWLRDLVAVSGVRGSHPILSDLTKLRDMNWRIAEVRAIADQQEVYVEDRTKEILLDMMPGAGEPRRRSTMEALTSSQLFEALTAATDDKNPDGLITAISDRAYASAKESLAPSWSTYQRLKFEAVLERLASEISLYFGYPRPSSEAGFIAATWIAWGRAHPAWQERQTPTTADAATLDELLQGSDMPYRERRLAFILARINDWYDSDDASPTPPVDDLDALKTTAWTLLEELRDATLSAVGQVGLGGALELLRLKDDQAVRLDPEAFAAANQKPLQDVFDAYTAALGSARNDSEKLLAAYREHTARWPKDAKDSLLRRYLGFALWDALLFPTLSLSELPQLTPIPVAQFSPLAATALAPPPEKNAPDEKPAKLKGIPVKHFAAFFAAKFRENDYLWGRLDGAELILKMLTDVANEQAGERVSTAAEALPARLPDALQAVLDSETGLSRIKDLRAYLAGEVTRLRRRRPRRSDPD